MEEDGSDLEELGEDGLDVEEGHRPRRYWTLDDRARMKSQNMKNTHLPYRNCCRHCIKGRGTELPHRKSKNDR